MTKEERIAAFAELGRQLRNIGSGQPETEAQARLETLTHEVKRFNPWFQPEEVRYMIAALGQVLTREGLERWLADYDTEKAGVPKTVAVIMAGNVPLVGFHDFMSVLLSGHKLLAKLSSDDRHLLPAVAEMLFGIEPRFREYVRFSEGRITGMDAVIATGSNNSARYFEHYFAKYPHIIRKNRHGVAVLTGGETSRELEALAGDVFRYFGLGCRNVTKLFVPRDYGFNAFFEAIYSWGDPIMAHTKYMNNYDYHKALYLLNKQPLLDNNFLLLKEDIALSSPPGVLFYERYDDLEEVRRRVRTDSENIQCVVTDASNGFASVDFGTSQLPGLADYADGVDTMRFLVSLS